MDQDKVLEHAAEQQRESAAARKLDAVFTCPSCGRASGTCALNCPRAQSGIGLTQHIFDTALAMNRAAAAQCVPVAERPITNAESYAQGVVEGRRQFAKRIAHLEATLEECLEYFEGRYDVVDGEYGEPRANKAMQMGQAIEEALGRRP